MISAAPVSGSVPVTVQPSALVSATPHPGGGLSFGDILDAVNPLEHIPIVSNLFRAVTGSHISAVSQIAGDTLYGALLPGGALLGLASSAANVAVKEAAGKDIGQLVVNAVSGSSSAQTTSPTKLVATPSIGPVASAADTDKKTTTPAIGSVPLLKLYQHSAGNTQYMRAQALDSINSKLVKMGV